MVLITQSGPETLSIGTAAPDFDNLPATDGGTYSLSSFSDKKALVIAFTCNHCPYAQAYEDRFIALVNEFSRRGVGFIAINPNDAETYPDDSFDSMVARAKERGFPFVYVRDDSQEVARAYGAVCTPHYFVLDADRKIAYEGRIDDNWQEPEKATAHDLKDALAAIAEGKPAPNPNTNPMGCSIKWIKG